VFHQSVLLQQGQANVAPLVSASCPWGRDYDAQGAHWSKHAHHERVSDRAYEDRPGGWWKHLQEQSDIVFDAGADLHDNTKTAALPKPPWLSQRPGTCPHGSSKEGCAMHTMRYMPRSVWQ
jgi:hypothetical protein